MDALVSGCSRNTHVNCYGSGKDALVSGCSRNMNVIMVGHGCSSDRMLAKHERYHGLNMDAMLTVCSRNTNVIIVWAWMAERSRTALCCPATKHCEYGHKMVSGSLASAQNPRLSAKLSSYNPLKTARLHQAGGNNKKFFVAQKQTWDHQEFGFCCLPSSPCLPDKKLPLHLPWCSKGMN